MNRTSLILRDTTGQPVALCWLWKCCYSHRVWSGKMYNSRNRIILADLFPVFRASNSFFWVRAV